MSQTGLPHDVVEYPCSDGQPMAETDLHAMCMVYVTCALRRWFERRGQEDVYVGSNNFLYYERGNPRAVVAPDVYVVVGVPAHLRDTYLLWNEPQGPDFVLEVTSPSTRREDEGRKRGVYAALGVSEYFLYDPRAEYLTPPVAGVSPARWGLPAAAGADHAAGAQRLGAQRGAGTRPARRARGADGAPPRPGDRAGPAHLRGVGTGARRGRRGSKAGSRGSTTGSRRSPGGGSTRCGAGSPSPGFGRRPVAARSGATSKARTIGTDTSGRIGPVWSGYQAIALPIKRRRGCGPGCLLDPSARAGAAPVPTLQLRPRIARRKLTFCP